MGILRALRYLAVCLVLLLPSPGAWAQETAIPAFDGWVIDTTGTLAPETIDALTQKLSALDREKGAQLAVLMMPTTGAEAIESYATRAFTQWRLGRKGSDDGILLLVALDDRKLRIEVGYGLEGAVPDILAGRIIREQITPRFREGQFSEGVVAGVDSLLALIDGEPLPPPASGNAHADADSGWDEAGILFGLILMAWLVPIGVPTLFIGIFAGIVYGSLGMGILAALLALVVGLVARVLRGGARQSVAASRHGRGRLGRYGGIGGGLGGGGFGSGGGFGGGGFGGGGGGSSGGGGASGSW